MEDMLVKSVDSNFTVMLSKTCQDKMLKELETCQDKETGGILLGKYSDDKKVAYVNYISSSPVDSMNGFTWFKRGVAGLQKKVDEFWMKSQGYYLGEWHLHPNCEPNPSIHDLVEMKRISKDSKYKCPEPILVILGGNIDVHTFSIHIIANDQIMELK